MRILGALLAMTLTASAGAALAQDGAPQGGEPQDGAPQCREVRPGHVECDPRVIEGTPQRPRAFVLIDRARDRYEAPPLERDLAREIRRSVRRAPF